MSDIYLAKIGAMVTATVRGQFVIAFCQGLAGAVSIYIGGGIHQGFFMFVIFLTVLSVIPLGSGIVTIPLGIGMALTGNIAGGVFVACSTSSSSRTSTTSCVRNWCPQRACSRHS